MLIITFSGLDGSGKSTHVELTAECLAARGLRVRRLVTLHLAATGIFAWIRESLAARCRAPDTSAPAVRSDPRVRSYPKNRTFDEDRRHWAVRARRTAVYPFDCVLLAAAMLVFRLRGYQAVVCDRYIHDKMVALPRPACFLSWIMRLVAPRPDHAFFLRVEPAEAERRKPEHHPDYFVTKDAAYQQVVDMNIGLVAVPSTSIDETQACIEAAIAGSFAPQVVAA